ncbi:hypothetical protein SS50377_20029 [Spironucleus salmonicida]|uniref:Uncharacterized protein n=1 Tax=Spironucleus salmonicida TaxID=348837 RepID=V6LXP1_9EUKA|nr:hypothetical protein SS50377_20029 [Spironucleus salmonicida]|eukprot:EST49402.1 hypothetical protein SS50377_10327 [Spironucleus salmonicida]
MSVVPTSLLELQLDFIVVPFDQKISSKFDKKLKELLVPKIDLTELIQQLSQIKKLPPRCVLFIKPHALVTVQALYNTAFQMVQKRGFPYLVISELAFDRLLDDAQRVNFQYFEQSAIVQGLDGKQIENNVRQILTNGHALPLENKSTASIQIFLMSIQDANHRYAPKFSDQLKSDKPIQLNMIVPATFHKGTNYYSPIQLLPQPCDDPTNPYFYINDCRYAYNYKEQVVQLPVPRLLINGFQLLPFSENIIKKNEELTKTASDLAWVYTQIENTLFVAVHALSQILSNGIIHVQYVSKLIQEQIQALKSGNVTKIDFQSFDFFFNPQQGKYTQVQNLDSFEEPNFDLIQISEGNLGSIQTFVQQTVICYQSSVEAITLGYLPDLRYDPDKLSPQLIQSDINYLQKSLEINVAEVEFTVFSFIKRILDNSSTDSRFIMDFDEMGSVLASNLRLILYKQFLSGYFNTNLEPNIQLYNYIKVQIKYMSPLDRYRIDSREFKYHYQRKYQQFVEQNYQDNTQKFDISLKSILYVFWVLEDPIAIRPVNQPELKDSVFLIQKNAVHFTSFDIISIFTQLLRINKKIRDKQQAIPHSKQQFNQYYVLNDETDSDDEGTMTIKDQIQQQRIAEDISNGKCVICSTLYNNYKEHIQSKAHKDKYLQALKHENLYEPLIQISKQFETKSLVKNQMSTICQLLSQRTNCDFSYTAQQLNKVLQNIGGTDLLIDIDDVPRTNSPTCRTEQFGKWREQVLKQRYNQFEEKLSLQQDSPLIELDTTTIACAWQIYEDATIQQNIKDALYNIIEEYGTDQEIANVKLLNAEPTKFQLPIAEKQKIIYDKTFTGLNEIIDHNELYAELIKITSQFKEEFTQDQNIPEVNNDSMASMTKDEFLIFQDYTKQQLQLILSPKSELKFEDLYFEFTQNLDTDSGRNTQDSIGIDEIKDAIDKYEINQNIKANSFTQVDQQIGLQKENILKDLIPEDIKKSLTPSSLVLPPIFVQNNKIGSSIDEMVSQVQKLDIQTSKKQQFKLPKKTNFKKLTQLCIDHYSDLQIINDFFDTEIDTFQLDYIIQDDIKIKYIPSNDSNNFNDDLIFNRVKHLTRCNTIPGPIMLFKYQLTPVLGSSDVFNSVLISQLPKDNPSRLLQQAPNTSDDQDFSQTFTQQPTLQPAVQPSLANSSPWNELVQNFDFSGEYPTFENTSLTALQAACALILTQTGPTALSGSSAFAFDAISAGITASTENGVDPEQLSVIYAAGAARIAQQTDYTEATVNSRTVQRRILGSGLFQ